MLDGRGILAGAGTGSEGAPEILEEEWSAKPRDAGAVVPRPVPMNGKMNGRVDGVGAIPLQVAEVEPASLIGEQTARRALAAALLGLILPFGALQIYSLWLAMRSLTASGSLRPGTRSRLALALVLDIAWIVLFAVLVRATLRR